MDDLPPDVLLIIRVFAPLFTERGNGLQVLLIGTNLTTGQRTVTAGLQVMGLSDERRVSRHPTGSIAVTRFEYR